MSPTTEDKLVRALSAAAHAFLAELEPPAQTIAQNASTQAPTVDVVEWDPLYGPPPFPADPNSTAVDARDRKDIAVIAFLGGIARVNAEFGRGATSEEIRQFALNGGYSRGNAVNGWNSNDRAHGAVEVRQGKQRFLNSAGHETHLRPAIERQARRLRVIGDMTPIDIPSD